MGLLKNSNTSGFDGVNLSIFETGGFRSVGTGKEFAIVSDFLSANFDNAIDFFIVMLYFSSRNLLG